MKTTPSKPKMKRVRKKSLVWNSEINLGHILTIAVIVIAAIGLYYQKRTLALKVDEMQKVIDKIEEERLNRELQGLEGETKMTESFSYNLDFTLDQFNLTGRIYDNEFMFLLCQTNNLIELFLKYEKLTIQERKELDLLKNRNNNKYLVFTNRDIYRTKVEEFEKINRPIEKNFNNIDDYISAQKLYNDTLQKHVIHLLSILDTITKEPIKNVILSETEYYKLRTLKK